MKRFGMVLLGLFILVTLAGASYAAFRLFNAQAQAGNALFGGPVMVHMEPAEEVPQSEPDLVGILVRRQDNSLFLGTGNIKFHKIRYSDAEEARFESGYDGPVVEVLVTHQTEIYYDITDRSEMQESNGKIQQVVRTGSIDELGEDHLFQVWGERQGDRVQARVLLVFSPPA